MTKKCKNEKITSALFIMAVIGICNGQTTSEITTTEVAKNELQLKLEGIPEGSENDFGFLNRAQFKKATLGNPIHTSAIDSEGNVIDLDEDKFPVMVDEKVIGLLTVAKVNGVYRAVEFGIPILAKKIEKVETSYGKVNNLLRAFDMKSNFVSTESKGNMNGKTAKIYIPLESSEDKTASKLGKNSVTNKLLSLEEIKAMVKSN